MRRGAALAIRGCDDHVAPRLQRFFGHAQTGRVDPVIVGKQEQRTCVGWVGKGKKEGRLTQVLREA